jgi:NADPH-dependent curcumin reductase CurA
VWNGKSCWCFFRFSTFTYVVSPQISKYDALAEQADSDPINGLAQVVSKQLLIQGFLVANPDFGPAYAKEHQAVVQKAMAEGTFRTKLCVTEGIDTAPQAFADMLRGASFGKPVLKIADDRGPLAETSSL